jgi:glycosyltransferase involved in cell wall biosynthesis
MHGIFEFDQAKTLVKAGCRVAFTVVDIRSIRRWRKWGVDRYEHDGVSVFRINIPGGRLPRSVQNRLIKFGLRTLYPLIEKEFGKPDVIHSHFTSLGYAAACMKERLCAPLVVTEHSSEMLKVPLNKKLHSMAQKAYSTADVVVAVSPALAAVIKTYFGITPEYIPNVVDTSLFFFNPGPRATITDCCFISVGGLIESKRLNLLIEAFARAFNGNPDVSLVIFGEGPERRRLERMIRDLGQEDRITLMGAQPRSVIAKKMQSCRCFVLPSHHETFGVVYIEAMASGLPIIATRCGGPEHFIHEENGLLIPVDDVQALIGAMRYMYLNFSRYDSNRISGEAKKLFSPESVGKQLMEIYKELIS